MRCFAISAAISTGAIDLYSGDGFTPNVGLPAGVLFEPSQASADVFADVSAGLIRSLSPVREILVCTKLLLGISIQQY